MREKPGLRFRLPIAEVVSGVRLDGTTSIFVHSLPIPNPIIQAYEGRMRPRLRRRRNTLKSVSASSMDCGSRFFLKPNCLVNIGSISSMNFWLPNATLELKYEDRQRRNCAMVNTIRSRTFWICSRENPGRVVRPDASDLRPPVSNTNTLSDGRTGRMFSRWFHFIAKARYPPLLAFSAQAGYPPGGWV